MKRARISTTIDAKRLARARQLSGLSDSKLLDRARDEPNAARRRLMRASRATYWRGLGRRVWDRG
ncbi:MAG: hypothetical protein ACR2KP_06295 [Egibacteraceae bacterium]